MRGLALCPRGGTVDAWDLKSLGGQPPCWFDSSRGHQNFPLVAWRAEASECANKRELNLAFSKTLNAPLASSFHFVFGNS